MPGERILVVDDDEITKRFLTSLLTDEGYELDVAAHADQALELCLTHRPALVIGELVVPCRAGALLLTALAELEGMAGVPLVVLSLRDREEDVVRGLTAGADDYIIKPFNARELVVRIRKQLDRPKVAG